MPDPLILTAAELAEIEAHLPGCRFCAQAKRNQYVPRLLATVRALAEAVLEYDRTYGNADVGLRMITLARRVRGEVKP